MLVFSGREQKKIILSVITATSSLKLDSFNYTLYNLYSTFSKNKLALPCNGMFNC